MFLPIGVVVIPWGVIIEQVRVIVMVIVSNGNGNRNTNITLLE